MRRLRCARLIEYEPLMNASFCTSHSLSAFDVVPLSLIRCTFLVSVQSPTVALVKPLASVNLHHT